MHFKLNEHLNIRKQRIEYKGGRSVSKYTIDVFVGFFYELPVNTVKTHGGRFQSFVIQLLNNLGFGYILDCQECFNENLFLHEVKQRLNDWFVQEAHSFFESSPKYNLYSN